MGRGAGEARFAGEQNRGEDIVDAPAHRDHAGLDTGRAAELPGGADLHESPVGAGARLLERRRVGRQRPPRGELRRKQLGPPLSGARPSRRTLMPTPDRYADRRPITPITTTWVLVLWMAESIDRAPASPTALMRFAAPMSRVAQSPPHRVNRSQSAVGLGPISECGMKKLPANRHLRGYSSAGRAPGSHPGGRRFESA
mgnify:CR=1 FL=1